MEDQELREIISETIEKEAAAVERRVTEDPQLVSIAMPEDSAQDLMRRIEESRNPFGGRHSFHIRKKRLLTIALAAVLVIAAGLGASGAGLFRPKVKVQENVGGVKIFVENGETFDAFFSIEETYEEIESRLGIQALRLGYKPKGMKLERARIESELGEASMEFVTGSSALMLYENKQKDNASTGIQVDGKVIATIENIYEENDIDIVEFDRKDGEVFFQTQLERGNAYYYLATDMELEEFEKILAEIYFKNM